MQIGCGIAITAARCNSVAKHLSSRLTERVRSFVRATVFDAAQRLEQQRRRDLRDWQAANPREQVLLHALDPAFRVFLAPSFAFYRVQLSGDCGERRPCNHAFGQLVELPPLGWIDAASLNLARVVSRFAGLLQRHAHLLRARLRIAAQREALLLAAVEVLPEPAPGPIRTNLEIEASAVGKSRSCLANGTHGVSAFRIGKGHGEQPPSSKGSGSLVPRFPQSPGASDL